MGCRKFIRTASQILPNLLFGLGLMENLGSTTAHTAKSQSFRHLFALTLPVT